MIIPSENLEFPSYSPPCSRRSSPAHNYNRENKKPKPDLTMRSVYACNSHCLISVYQEGSRFACATCMFERNLKGKGPTRTDRFALSWWSRDVWHNPTPLNFWRIGLYASHAVGRISKLAISGRHSVDCSNTNWN